MYIKKKNQNEIKGGRELRGDKIEPRLANEAAQRANEKS